MNLSEKIKLKTQQILAKTDDYLRGHTYCEGGAVHHGICFAGTSLMLGFVGISGMFDTASLPALNAVASNGINTMTGHAISNAGVAFIGASGVGVIFSTFAQIYQNIRGEHTHDIFGSFEIYNKDGSLLTLPRKEVLKNIENGTFNDQYCAIKTLSGQFIVHNEEGILEKAVQLPYLDHDNYHSPNYSCLKEDCYTIRRECFKESRNSDLTATILQRIGQIRLHTEKQNTKIVFDKH